MAEIKPASRKRSASLNLKQNCRNWRKCLCHVAKRSGKLTLLTEKSWEKFEKCSFRRKDHIWLTMMNHWIEGPNRGYHRQCYQSYTNIGNISRTEGTATDKATPASANHEISVDEPSKEPAAKRFHISHVQIFDIDKCIICQEENVNSERERSQWKL